MQFVVFFCIVVVSVLAQDEIPQELLLRVDECERLCSTANHSVIMACCGGLNMCCPPVHEGTCPQLSDEATGPSVKSCVFDSDCNSNEKCCASPSFKKQCVQTRTGTQ